MKKVEVYQRGFKGVWIPAEIWLNENLNLIEKAILVEIDSLDRHYDEGGDYCYASNEHFANFCGCGITKVSTTISKLVDLGYVEIVKTDGRKRWIKSNIKLCLSKNERQTNEKCISDTQKMKESNTSNNSFINTTYKIDKYNRSIPKRNTTGDLSIDIIDKQIDKVCRTDSRYDADDIKNMFRYYFAQYRKRFRKEHPRLTTKNIEKILYRYYYESGLAGSMEYDELTEMIDIHFNRDYGMEIDYNINHFVSAEIFDRLACEVGI